MSERSGSVTMIMGPYPFIREGRDLGFKPGMMQEIKDCLTCNPFYRERMLFLAGDRRTAAILESLGLCIARTFEDAPGHAWSNTAPRMKHWMALWALREFGEYLWVDWDTVAVAEPDAGLWEACRAGGTPKFILIPGYKHAIVNCGVVYVPGSWADAAERSFGLNARSANDEHIWETVLPGNVLDWPEFCFGPEVQYVSQTGRARRVTHRLRLAHLGRGSFEAATVIRQAHERACKTMEASHAY